MGDERGRANGSGRRRRWPWVVAAVALLWWLSRQVGFVEGPASIQLDVPVASDAASESGEPPLELPLQDPIEPPPEGLAGPAAERPVLLVGRCELAGDDPASLPRAVVRLTGATEAGGAGRTEEIETDSTGAFEVLWSGDPPETVEVLPRAGFTLPLEPRELTGPERDGRAPIELVVEREPMALLRGRVLAGDEVGFGLEVELTGPGWAASTEHTTNARGDFSSVRELTRGTYEAVVVDDAPEGRLELGRFTLDHDPVRAPGREHVLEPGVGPTLFAILVGAEATTGRWQIRLVERRGDPELAGRLVRTAAGFRAGSAMTEVEESAWSWRTLRTDARGGHFVRWPSEEVTVELASHTRFVQIRSADGGWFGEAPAPRNDGSRERPLTLRPAPTASLAGRLVDGSGEPIAQAQVWLDADDHAAVPGPWITGADGRFEIPIAAPGSHRLSVFSGHRPEVELTLELDPGRNELQPVVVPPLESDHLLRGTLRCDRDHGPGTVVLEVRSRRGRELARTVVRRLPAASPRTPAEASFVVEGLEPGSYAIEPLEIRGEHHWTPDVVRVTTPAPRVELVCTGDRPLRRGRVAVTDAESGDPLSAATVFLGPVRQEPFSWPESPPRERWYGWPLGGRLPWTVWAPGYQPASAEPGITDGSETTREVVVDLRRGFGARLVLRELAAGAREWRTAPPIAGVRVAADGRPVGTTDDFGELLVGLDAAPDALDLLHPRWRLVDAEEVETDEPGPPTFVAWLQPRAR